MRSERLSRICAGPRLVEVAVVLALLVVAQPARSAAPARPNIILIIGDDHAWPDAGFMGHPVAQTPNLDELARGATLFTNAHNTASTCVPSHRSLLAGIHSVRWAGKQAAVEALLGPLARRAEVEHYRTLPRELARAGYRSWEGGKLWEGSFEIAGFTAGLATAVGPPLRPVGVDFGRRDWDAGACAPTGDPTRPCPALEPLREFLDDGGEEPFFLWFAPALPHAPLDPPQEFLDLYADVELNRIERRYLANVSRLDALVGDLVQELDARGLRENTLLIYISDNGWTIGNFFGVGVAKGKGTLYELGFRTPIIFHWPGRVPEGVVRDDLVSSLDLFPTILEYAGLESPPDRRGRSLRGPSRPVLPSSGAKWSASTA